MGWVLATRRSCCMQALGLKPETNPETTVDRLRFATSDSSCNFNALLNNMTFTGLPANGPTMCHVDVPLSCIAQLQLQFRPASPTEGRFNGAVLVSA